MAITRAEFPLPDVDEPLTAPFFAAAARDELAIPRCEHCGQFVWYPKPSCPSCASPSGREPQASGGGDGRLVWTAVSGRATLFTWTVVRRAFLPAFADRVPFVTALVALDEDPAVRLCTYLVDVEPDAPLEAGTTVAVTFRDLTFSTVPDDAVRVPMFAVVPSKPDKSGSDGTTGGARAGSTMSCGCSTARRRSPVPTAPSCLPISAPT